MDGKVILPDGFWLNANMEMYRATGESEYRDAVLDALNANPSPEAVSYGRALLFAWQETGEEQYKTAAGTIRAKLQISALTDAKELYAALPFIAAYDTSFGDKQSYKAIARQVEAVAQNNEKLCDLENKAYMLLALADTAERMDMQIYEHYRVLADLFLNIARRLLPCRKGSLFDADSVTNCMIACALFKGVRLGLVDEEKYLPVALEMAAELEPGREELKGLWLLIEAEMLEVDDQ